MVSFFFLFLFSFFFLIYLLIHFFGGEWFGWGLGLWDDGDGG